LEKGVGGRRWSQANTNGHFESCDRLTAESTFAARGRLGRVTALLNALGARVYGALELRLFKAAAERRSGRRRQAQ